MRDRRPGADPAALRAARPVHALPIVGNILAAPQTVKDADDAIRHAREGRWTAAAGSALAAGAGLVFPAGRAAAKGTGRGGKKPVVARAGKGPRDPDGHPGETLAGSESTARYFREVHRDGVWRTRFRKKTPTVGVEDHKGKPIKVGGGRPDVLVGEARLHKDGGRSYALNLRGERVYIDRSPSRSDPNTVWKPAGDGGHWVTRRLDSGQRVTVYYNPYGLPEFPARGAFWLPPKTIEAGRDAHREYVRKRLQDMAEANSEELGKMGFTAEQIERMKDKVNLRELGIEIHHDYRVGRMVIVDRRFHKFAHKGGRSLW